MTNVLLSIFLFLRRKSRFVFPRQEIANQTDDYFVVDVTNGISWVRGLTQHITVIPELVYIDGGELQCLEGASVTFPTNFFPVRSEYYEGKVTDFRVVSKPNHGTIRSSRHPETTLHKFSSQQLEAGLMQVEKTVYIIPIQKAYQMKLNANFVFQYLHDGSEFPEDEFVVIGKVGEKESVPAKVTIIIKPINDQKPVLVANVGLELWAGSSTIISSSHLGMNSILLQMISKNYFLYRFA